MSYPFKKFLTKCNAILDRSVEQTIMEAIKNSEDKAVVRSVARSAGTAWTQWREVHVYGVSRIEIPANQPHGTVIVCHAAVYDPRKYCNFVLKSGLTCTKLKSHKGKHSAN